MNVLIVDDDATVRKYLADQLARRGHEVRAEPGPAAAIASVIARPPDVVLYDLVYPTESWNDLPSYLDARTDLANVAVIVCTALPVLEFHYRCVKAVLNKPLDVEDIEAALAKLRETKS